MTIAEPLPETAAPDLLACPVCDMLHTAVDVPAGGRLICQRCGTVLMTNRPGAFDRTLVAAVSSVILIFAAITFPFLELSVAGLHRQASVLDVAGAFSGGLIVWLSVAISLLIIVIPLARAAALAYTILPLRLGRPPAPGAARVFRLAHDLKPWSMAEVFMVGVVVALVKIAGLATISLGPAFWALIALVVLVIYEGASLCERTVWLALETHRR